MIEFTISRVVLSICGIALLTIAMAAAGATDDRVETDLDDEAAEGIADILDRFEDSVLRTLTLEAHDVLPSRDHILTVSDHMVMLECDGRMSVAYTASSQEFTLDWDTGSVTLTRPSVPEGLGDMPDGVGEDVDLLQAVVDVRGGAGAAVDPPRDVERMRAVHA